jgi:hypothetical protein
VETPPFRDDLAAALELEGRLRAENEELVIRCQVLEHVTVPRTPFWYYAILITCLLVTATALLRGKVEVGTQSRSGGFQ